MAQDKQFTIRRAGSSDAAAILDCLAEAFAPYRQSYNPEVFQDTVLTPETLDQRLKSMVLLVAADGAGTIAGTVAFSVVGEEGHLRGMAVRSKWQGAGLAQQLLEGAESELRARGCTRITLDTTAPLQRAIRFYEKNGYRLSGKVNDFFGMPLYEYVKE